MQAPLSLDPAVEEEFIFTLVKDNCVCMLCHQTQALSKRGNLEWHLSPNHQNSKTATPPESNLLAKHKKPFTDGDLFKEAMATTVQQTVFSNFKNKENIKTTSVVYHLALQYFSPQCDESPDVMDTAQLVVFVRMAFQDSTK